MADTMLKEMGKKARAACARLSLLNPDVKNHALRSIAQHIERKKSELQEANALDVKAGKEKGLSDAMVDRLVLNDKCIKDMIAALEQVAALDDPVGEIYDMKVRPNGLMVGRMRVPIGVIGIIYESRPNVTCDAAALCVKSGNTVILRGGSEAIHSNKKIAELMNEAGTDAGLPEGAIQLIPTTERAVVNEMLKMNDFIDLIIPRGGKGLIETVTRESTIPVIKHYDGNCYIYVDEDVDEQEALEIVINAKTQRPSVCNALETLLVHKDVAESFLSALVPRLKEKGVELRGCEKTRAIISDAKEATEDDWRTEYLDLILAIKVADSIEEAMAFINEYGSHHTDAILTRDHRRAMDFLRGVDSACVFVNTSTRFSDGGEFGMGCEIGISTDKLHARGPMGLKELTTSKFVVFGKGQIRT